VDDYGQSVRLSEVQLAAENGLLDVSRRVVVVIIEADFADRDDLLVLCKLFQFKKMLLGGELRLVRVDADGGVNPVAAFGHFEARSQAMGTGATTDGYEMPDAAIPRPVKHLLAILVKLRKLQVGVGVD
jgi:hypothetical protein